MKWNGFFSLALAAAAVAVVAFSTPLFALDTDSTLKSAIENSFVFKSYLKDDTIKIAVKDGVVTLSGTVADQAHKVLAQETAASLAGVVRVDNQLATLAEVAAANADSWIGRKVKLTLLFHRNVNAHGTQVDVKDGVVTLKGEALNPAQRELTAEYAKDIEGVKEVKIEMTVATAPVKVERTVGQKIDDASVTAQVKMALLTHRSTSAIATKVETLDGAVTLTGIAKSEAEKSLVSKLVDDIQGVTSLKNLMTVQETK